MRIKLNQFKTTSNFRSLSTTIAIAMCVGLLVPALIGIFAINYLRQDNTSAAIDAYLNDKVVLLANSLALPVWNFDLNSANKIASATLLDPQVVKITIFDTKKEPILTIDHPDRRIGSLHSSSQPVMLNDQLAGFVELEVDDGLMKQKSLRDQLDYTYIFLIQFVLALTIILIALHYRVLKPLKTLTDFSHQLADGDFERAVHWQRRDEIGHLASQLDQMRRDLHAAFSEQQAILNNVPAGVIFMRNGIIQLANRHAEEIFGYPKGGMQELPSKSLYLSHQQYLAIRKRALAIMTSSHDGFAEELQMRRRNGHEFWARLRGNSLTPHDPKLGSIWVFEDITQRKAAESEITHLAFYDPLTKLPNRRLLLDRLSQALNCSLRTSKCGALLFIDLDDFKTLNDTYGHESGDILLQQVAERLTTCVRQDDTVARLGGDEFVILLEGLSNDMTEAAAAAKNISEKIRFSLNQCYQIDSHLRYSTPSIGVTLFIDHHESVEEILKRADMAMYEAKAAGRNTIRFFDQKMQDMLMLRAVLEDDLRNAILNSEFQLYYQPQITSNNLITGVEALIRWKHPKRGFVPPSEFIPLAEDSGFILSLGHWVLRSACLQIKAWEKQNDMSNIVIAVNVSARQFHQTNFVENVLNILEQTGANPLRLKIELTESMLIHDVDDIILKMTLLKALGVCFSLDDFGTGYSSLSYLKRLPLDQLKIDQSFVKNILNDNNDVAIAKMVIALGLSLNLNVIAEGVELEAQKECLTQLGCNDYQGYLFSKPLPLLELEAFCRGKKSKNLDALAPVL